MSYATVSACLEQTFKNGWGTRTRIEWDNVHSITKKELPSSNSVLKEESFVRFTLLFGDSEPLGYGATKNMERHVGVITLSVFVAESLGSRIAREHIDVAAPLFRLKHLTTSDSIVVRCQTSRIVPVGVTDRQKGWWQENMEVPFTYDDFITRS